MEGCLNDSVFAHFTSAQKIWNNILHSYLMVQKNHVQISNIIISFFFFKLLYSTLWLFKPWANISVKKSVDWTKYKFWNIAKVSLVRLLKWPLPSPPPPLKCNDCWMKTNKYQQGTFSRSILRKGMLFHKTGFAVLWEQHKWYAYRCMCLFQHCLLSVLQRITSTKEFYFSNLFTIKKCIFFSSFLSE